MAPCSSPPAITAGRLHTIQRESSAAGCSSSGSCSVGSNTVMTWPLASMQCGTSTVSPYARIIRSASELLPVPGGPYRNMAPSPQIAGPSWSMSSADTTRSL
jgi:hypothetical protein